MRQTLHDCAPLATQIVLRAVTASGPLWRAARLAPATVLRAERDSCIHACLRERRRFLDARSRRPDDCPIPGSLSAVSRPRSGEQRERSLRHGRGLPHNASPGDGTDVPHGSFRAVTRAASRIQSALSLDVARAAWFVMPQSAVVGTWNWRRRDACSAAVGRSVEGARHGTDIDTDRRGVSDPRGRGGVDPPPRLRGSSRPVSSTAPSLGRVAAAKNAAEAAAPHRLSTSRRASSC